MDFSKYITPIISIGVYLIFLMIKKLIPEEYKKFIPLMAGTLGVLLMIWYSMKFDFSIFLTGLASGLSATGIDNAIDITNDADKVKIYDPKKEGVD